VIGLGVALGLTRLMTSMLLCVKATDQPTLTAVVGAFFLVAIALSGCLRFGLRISTRLQR
jgi:hypothetical protein